MKKIILGLYSILLVACAEFVAPNDRIEKTIRFHKILVTDYGLVVAHHSNKNLPTGVDWLDVAGEITITKDQITIDNLAEDVLDYTGFQTIKVQKVRVRNKQNTTIIYDYLAEQCEVSISIKNGYISDIQYKFNSGSISFMNIVEIHHFCCVNCGYSDSCVGHRWEDGTPLAKFTSFACKDCKRLCDNSYLKGVPDIIALQEKGEAKWIYSPTEPFCMWCGSKNVEEWSEDNPVCPKCGGVMKKL